jgi:hypothetical protein
MVSVGMTLRGSAFAVRRSAFGVSGFGFRVPRFGFRVSSFEFRVSSSGFRVPGAGCRVPLSGFSIAATKDDQKETASEREWTDRFASIGVHSWLENPRKQAKPGLKRERRTGETPILLWVQSGDASLTALSAVLRRGACA